MTRKMQCPSCAAKGEDRSQNNLSVYADGKGGYCHKCSQYHPLNGGGGERVPYEQNENQGRRGMDVAAISLLSSFAWPERGISEATMERYGVKATVDESTGKPDAFFYPYHDESGTVVAYKKRTVPKAGFPWVGKPKGMFGQKQCKQNGQFLIIVEGEHDVLAVYEMLASMGKFYNVVSIPNGANEEGTLDASTRKELEWITTHKKVALCCDNDGPGKAMARGLADAIVGKCEVRIVELPLKDAGDMLQAKRTQDFYRALSSAKEHKPEMIVMGNEESLDELLTPLKAGITFSFIPKTCAKLRGFRTREVNTIISPANSGKSSIMRQMMYEILHTTDEKVGGFYLEETIQKTKQSILSYHTDTSLSRFRENPNIANRRLVEEAYDSLLPRLCLFESKSRSLSDDLIERKIEYMVQAQGCKTVFFDHLSFVIGGREGGDERRAVDNLMTRLARSVEDLDYRLFLVSHIKRGGKEESRSGREKYPYWEVLDMHQARSSGAIEQLSHNMIAFEKQMLDPEGDNTRGLLRSRVLRSREWGVVGVGDYLTMGPSGKFVPVEAEY